MTEKVFNVLFLCTGNSARSIMAEAIMNSLGKGKFRAYSAGSHPSGRVHPLALDTLHIAGLPTEDARSKAWDDFAEAGAPRMDFVFTVCDNAAGEVCPVWPGQPMTAHWGVEDPAAFEGTDAERRAFFLKIFRMLQNRISVFASLPVASLDRQSLLSRIKDIGHMRDETASAAKPA